MKCDIESGNIEEYECGLIKESDEQNKQIQELRKKYLPKILLCDINKSKATLMKEENKIFNLMLVATS